jgi:hypothetical protein
MLFVPRSVMMNFVQVANLEVFNHAVSSKKFRIIQMFLELGWNVFLADIDIVILRVPPPPFSHLPYLAGVSATGLLKTIANNYVRMGTT